MTITVTPYLRVNGEISSLSPFTLLVLAFILGLAACASSEVSSASAESQEAAVSIQEDAESPAKATAIAEDPKPAEEPAQELSDMTGSSDSTEPEEQETTVLYPLSDEEITLTYWNLYMNNLTGFLDDYNDHYLNDESARQTGVRLEWHDISMASANENFNLIAASGDYLDFMPVSRYYTGGLAKALDDGAILNLSDYVEEWAPDYLQAMEHGDTRKELSDDEDRILQFYTIQD